MTTAISIQTETLPDSDRNKRHTKAGAFQATLDSQALGMLSATLDPTATASLPGAGTALVQADSAPKDAAQAAQLESTKAEHEASLRDRGQDVASRSSRELAEATTRSNPLGEASTEALPGVKGDGRSADQGTKLSEPGSGADSRIGPTDRHPNDQTTGDRQPDQPGQSAPRQPVMTTPRADAGSQAGGRGGAGISGASFIATGSAAQSAAGQRAQSSAGGGIGRIGSAGKVTPAIGPGLSSETGAAGAGKAKGVIRHETKTFEAQLQRGLAQVLRQRGGTLKLKLDPNDLGTVKISLKLSQGRIEGSIESANERARDLLKQHVDVLKHSLERRGITVDRLDVRHAGAAESGRQNVDGPEAQRGLDQQNAGSGDDRQTGSGRGEDRPHGGRGGIPGESEEAGIRGAESATDDAPAHGRVGEPLVGWLRLDTVV